MVFFTTHLLDVFDTKTYTCTHNSTRSDNIQLSIIKLPKFVSLQLNLNIERKEVRDSRLCLLYKKMVLIILILKSKCISNKIMIRYSYHGNKHINPSKNCYILSVGKNTMLIVEPSLKIFDYFDVSPILS